MSRRMWLLPGALIVSVALAASAANSQVTPPAQQTAPPLEIGAVAPDFELPGATRFGMLRDPVRLSDYRGKTIVLAFFFRARSKG